MSPNARDRMVRICAVVAALVYATTLADGAPQIARAAALVLAACATTTIVTASTTTSPRAAAMVSMAAITLTLEGAATAIAQEMDEAAFVEIGMGIYLAATLYEMVRERGGTRT